MRKTPTLLLASALLIPLAGCKTTDTAVTSPCVAQAAGLQPAWRAIGWSKNDTPETVDEVKANNARRKAWCGD